MGDYIRISRREVQYRRAKYFTKNFLDGSPFLYSCFYSVFSTNRTSFVSDETDVIVDGFPSSGNTFLYYSLKELVGDVGVNVSHHMHSASQIILGSRKGLPIFLCVRDPIECSASNTVRQKYSYGRDIIEAEVWLEYWVNYYERILRLADVSKLNVCQFEQVIKSPLSLLKDGLGSSFSVELSSKKNLEKDVFSAIKAEESKEKKGRYANASLPSEEKELLKERVKEGLMKNNKELLGRAYCIYTELGCAK